VVTSTQIFRRIKIGYLLSRGPVEVFFPVFLRYNFNDSIDSLLVFQCLNPQGFVFDGKRYLISEFCWFVPVSSASTLSVNCYLPFMDSVPRPVVKNQAIVLSNRQISVLGLTRIRLRKKEGKSVTFLDLDCHC